MTDIAFVSTQLKENASTLLYLHSAKSVKSNEQVECSWKQADDCSIVELQCEVFSTNVCVTQFVFSHIPPTPTPLCSAL